MPDYAAARRKMVEGQIMPAGVVENGLLERFTCVQRESFVSEGDRDHAFVDSPLGLPGGRFLLAPALHARLLAAAAPTSSDRVLDVGCGTGYGCAILSVLVARITALESDPILLKTARGLWTDEGYANITGVCGPLAEGWAADAPYTLAVVEGAVAELPEKIIGQLAPGGRLVTVLRESDSSSGRAVLIRRGEGGGWSRRDLFDASCPWVSEFGPASGFRFAGLKSSSRGASKAGRFA